MARLTVTVPELAEMLGCSRTHVHSMIRGGHLPTVPHMGRRVLIPRWAVDGLLGVDSDRPVERPASAPGRSVVRLSTVQEGSFS